MEVTGVDQLWVADLTYIRLAEQFVYLAVVLDAFSRKVVGWSLGEQLDAALTVAALRQAIDLRQPKMGLVHHSDRGTQYASHAYAELLEEHGIVASMSRPGNPYDNAQCESFMKTLKQEEIHTRSYRDLPHLEAHIGNFLDRYYNRRRLHSALGYRTPEDFERSLPAQPASAPVVTLSFPRHDGIDRPEERERTGERLEPSSSSSVRCVPAGYSSAGCSPAEPASASPARIKPQTTTPARQEKYSERQTGNFHRVSR
jgi:hypothetical protein